MLVFPQLSTGATAQYPMRKRRSERAVFNISEDGSVIALWDETASQVKWDLSFVELTDSEVANFSSFFELCQGPAESFLFIDPTGNLLAYSENLSQPVWQANSLISIVGGIQDPYNTTRGSRVTNNSLGVLSVMQTLAIPGRISTAFSVYARADQPTGALLMRTDGSTLESIPLTVTNAWTRFSLNTAFESSISDSCDFSLSVPPGETIDLFGFQLEPQSMAGKYVMTSAQTGIYPNSRFNGDQIVITATGPGASSVALSILSPSAQ